MFTPTMCHMSCVTCHESGVRVSPWQYSAPPVCCMSCVMCHLSHVAKKNIARTAKSCPKNISSVFVVSSCFYFKMSLLLLFEFCHNLSFWVLSQFDFFFILSQFEFSGFVTISVKSFSNFFLVWSELEFLSFVPICPSLRFLPFCCDLTFWVFSHF